MTIFDYAVIAILLISLALGVWRGLVYEVLSLLGWPLAFFVAKRFSAEALPFMPGKDEVIRTALAYAALFVVVMLIWAALVWMVSKLIRAIGLGWVDSVLGSVFGLLRGALVILVLVWLAGMTDFPSQPFWQQAQTRRFAEAAALQGKTWLPDNIAQRINYGSRI